MSRDYRDLFAELNTHGVDYIVVGSHALAVHGHVRATKDLDVWIRPEASNAPRVLRALASFGAAIGELTEKDLAQPGLIFQIGIAPVRIDILTHIDGVQFSDAWNRRVRTRFEDQEVSVLSREDLIANKKASGRTQDLADLEALEGE